jgi:hypothetical protein
LKKKKITSDNTPVSDIKGRGMPRGCGGAAGETKPPNIKRPEKGYEHQGIALVKDIWSCRMNDSGSWFIFYKYKV